MSELTDDYSAAGFGGNLGFGLKPAVILIDVARAYIEPDAPLYVGSEDAFQSMRKLVEMARAANVPIIWTRVEYRPGGADGGLFYQKVPVLSVFDEGNPLGDFDPRLEPADDELVITKQYPSAFFGTSLTSTLNMLRVDTCLLAGFSTSGCVRASTLDALQNGFRPIVVSEACGDRDPQVQSANLFDLEQKYADLKKLAEISDYFGRIAPA
ncbi:Nicotinamidase-related amidase [Parasphingorhabdus marina DSM 22363]|uniref:Nicotinamidase-related amidase n=1 Tax=Parasphingorhabdus marina DSM 22363 TaxID=1123272 RepID=A0A1N6DC27_9SPHN|nr:isochorismatase family protein [Parasphingorhabdus marina]SIN68355.1 Nicotinamidase-related amidase [Parasphingorhabdus marina DSM 22363]